MYRQLKRVGSRDIELCRCETEAECRRKLAERLPALEDGAQILLLRGGEGQPVRVLATYMRPPQALSDDAES